MDGLNRQPPRASVPPAPWRRIVGLVSLACLLGGSVSYVEPTISERAAQVCWDCWGASLVLAWCATRAWWLRLGVLLPLGVFYVWSTAMAVNFANF